MSSPSIPALSLDALVEARATSHQRRRGGPWSAEYVSRAVAGNALGLALIVFGAAQSAMSAQAETGTRLRWLTVAIIGLALGGASNALWLLRGHERLMMARAAVVASVRAQRVRAPSAPAKNDDTAVVWIARTSRFHRPDCLFVTGKTVVPAARETAEHDGLAACGACEP